MSSSDLFVAAGAFLSGAGSVAGAIYAIKTMRKRLREECEERIKLFREGIAEGRDLRP